MKATKRLSISGFWMKDIFSIASLIIGTSVFGSPVSKEYVDNKVVELNQSIALLQATITQQNQSLTILTTSLNGLHHQIGEFYQGGIIFWLDESKQHGLIAATLDAEAGELLQWQNGETGDKTTNATGKGIYSGIPNTAIIISEQTIDDQEGQFAAKAAHNFAVQADGVSACDDTEVCYGNWYLPSLAELTLMQQNLKIQGQGNFEEGPYWSSTEKGISEAYAVDFANGAPFVASKDQYLRVRVIRAF